MASLATTDNCPYCLQNINQGQSQYGPICNNGHRAHLNCIMNQFDHNREFNIDTWTCPMCRAPAYYSPDSGIPSLNQVLRERFPRRIADLEEEEYSSEEETDMEEEPDDSQGAFDAYAEALPANETPEAVNRINQLVTHFPFLGTNYRSEEQDALENIMNGLTQHVRMLGVFPESAQFQSTVDAAQMGAILMEQWYNIWNQTSAYEGEADMEEVHSSMTNQSEFFQALTRAILAGHRRGFWRIDAQQRLDLQVAINFNDPRSNAMASLRRRGGKRKKKTRRKRRGKKRKTRKKRGGAVTQFIVKNDQVNINAFFNEIRTRQIDGSYVEHSPSDELGLEHLHDMMMESLLTGEYVEGIYGVTYAPNRNEGPYGRFFADYFDDMNSLTERLEIVSENNRFPNSVTQLQSAVEEQILLPHPGGESPNTIMDVDDLSGGRKRRRKRKTRKKRGGRFVDVTPEYIRKNFDQLVGREVELSEEGVQKKIIIYKLRDETDDIVDYKDIIPIPTFFYYINVDDNQDIQTPRLIGVIDLTEYGPGSIKINVANIQDGSGKRRKKKTRKMRGGMDAPPTPPRPPKDNDRGTNRYPPGFTLPPPEVPVRIAQPQQVRMRRRGSRDRFRDRNPGARAPTQRMIDEHNERLRRDQNSRVRNVAGDVLEACTGSRCGLGGRRKKKRIKTRRKKYRKRRTKKKSRRRKRR